jgi:hypothetical protein
MTRHKIPEDKPSSFFVLHLCNDCSQQQTLILYRAVVEPELPRVAPRWFFECPAGTTALLLNGMMSYKGEGVQ